MTRSAPLPDGDGASLRAYEALRAHVLTGSPLARPAGLIVLLRQGVAAWRADRSGRAAAPSPATPASTPPVADDLQAAVVRVLVSMALAGHHEVRA